MRFFVSASAGATMAFLLFLLMSGLVSDAEGFEYKKQNRKLGPFLHIPRIENEILKPPREKPEEPKQIEKPEHPTADPTITSEPPTFDSGIDFPDIGIQVGGRGPAGGGPPSFGNSLSDGGAVPVLPPNPRYPREPLTKGIEGWVELEFTITETGTVSDATVINAEPSRVFNRAALHAIYRATFRPRIVDGVPTPQRATQRIEFNMESGN